MRPKALTDILGKLSDADYLWNVSVLASQQAPDNIIDKLSEQFVSIINKNTIPSWFAGISLNNGTNCIVIDEIYSDSDLNPHENTGCRFDCDGNAWRRLAGSECRYFLLLNFAP